MKRATKPTRSATEAETALIEAAVAGTMTTVPSVAGLEGELLDGPVDV